MTDYGDPISILLVDDQPRNLVALEAILDQPGYRIVTASSGPQALELVEAESFALVLLDIFMPEMDGFEVAQKIKSRERSRATPIIFLSAADEELKRVHRAYALGAVDYVTKPMNPDVVRAKVEVFVQLHRRTEQVKRQAELLREHDRRERERQLDELKSASERRYRDLAEAIPQMVWRADASGEVTYFTRRWREYTQMSEDAALGFGWLVAIHPDDREAFRASWLASVAKGARFQNESRVLRADGAYRWHLCQALPELGGREEVVGWLGAFTDVDAQKRADEERAELLRTTERAVAARDEFLSIASHELRTPVTSLALQIQTLGRSMRGEAREPLTPAGMVRQIALAEEQIERMSSLISALFDVSHIASGQFALHLEDVDLARVVSDVVDRVAKACAEEGSLLEVEAATPILGRWDKTRLEQVITNLLANALKYGGGRPIHVSAQARDGEAVLVVRDYGVGIAPENHARIFQCYERATAARSYAGLGLGLFIASGIVTAHGGTIVVKSSLGHGAEFTVKLPLVAR
jgi:PAS domain S-box-containing protein